MDKENQAFRDSGFLIACYGSNGERMHILTVGDETWMVLTGAI